MPQKSPRAISGRVRCQSKFVKAGKLMLGVIPETAYSVIPAQTHPAKSANVVIRLEPIPRHSRVNSAPPTGALNMAAIPAPAPMAIILRRPLPDIPSSLPTLSPIAAPE